MSRRLPALLLALVVACVAIIPTGVHAQDNPGAERILGYDSVVVVSTDGSLDVTEHITVHAEGVNIRRGIYRDFPTRYKDSHGNRVVVDLQVLGVSRDGEPEPWFIESRPNGVRINTGNDDFLPAPADHTFELHYRTTRQLGFFADHDELYWNAIGTGWDFPIEHGSVEVRLPQAVPESQMQAIGYTGAQGARGGDVVAEIVAPGIARWVLGAPLTPGEGLTIVLSFPTGVVVAPTQAQRIRWFFSDNRGVLVALLGLLLTGGFCLQRWRKIGRDPRAGVVIARYEPPAGHSPGGLRYLVRKLHDARCFSADLLALAVDGCVRIEREDKLLKDRWTLQQLPAAPPTSGSPQRKLYDVLFAGGREQLVLETKNAAILQKAQATHAAALKAQYQPTMFKRNGSSILIAVLIAGASIGLAFALSGGGALPIIVVCALVMMAMLITFAVLIGAPTPAGRKLLDEIAGLKLYLGVAEKDELARLGGPGTPPPMDADRYQRLLPYAVALEVEDAWTDKFTLAVGAAAAAASTAAMGWYQGARISDIGSFASSVGSSLSSQIASSSSPPGSSSGGGGGGFSGGGGGGGGGGGR
ncbi:MAG: DUF2207 domain-containing protein [Luteimonas sp.]